MKDEALARGGTPRAESRPPRLWGGYLERWLLMPTAETTGAGQAPPALREGTTLEECNSSASAIQQGYPNARGELFSDSTSVL